jgi:hypothetical protein
MATILATARSYLFLDCPEKCLKVAMFDKLYHQQQWFFDGDTANHVHNKLLHLIVSARHHLHHFHLLEEILFLRAEGIRCTLKKARGFSTIVKYTLYDVGVQFVL